MNVTRRFKSYFLRGLAVLLPTPITGPVVVMPRDETIALDMTVEEAVRFIVSDGVIAPDDRRPGALPAVPVEQKKC